MLLRMRRKADYEYCDDSQMTLLPGPEGQNQWMTLRMQGQLGARGGGYCFPVVRKAIVTNESLLYRYFVGCQGIISYPKLDFRLSLIKYYIL